MVDPITHLNLNAIILVVLVVFPSQYYSAEAQSAIQPASPFASPIVVWDVSSLCIITGALIATLLLVFVFLIFIRRFTNSHGHVAESKCEGVTGIHPQLLQTFPILLYSSITKHLMNLKEGPLQCAVCLADFNHFDTLRLLPQCNHVFHPPCIDAWLSSHVTCPVCRANLNHQHSLHIAISVDTETEDQTSGGCGSEEGKRNGDEEDKGDHHASKLKLSRSNSTGHSVVELEDDGVCVERYTLRLPEDVKKCMMMQRSASNNIVESSMRGLCLE